MNDDIVIADASTILALLKQEPFCGFNPQRLFRAAISAVNFSEVIEKLCSGGLNQAEADDAVAALTLRVIDFDAPLARQAAFLRPLTQHAGLSLADRACLALGLLLGRPVVTADRAWARVEVGVQIIMIR